MKDIAYLVGWTKVSITSAMLAIERVVLALTMALRYFWYLSSSNS